MAKVLVVDDDLELRAVYALILGDAGHDVAMAADLAEARRAIAGAVPDVIVLDYLMPGGNGDRLTRWLTAEGLKPAVVLVSGSPGALESLAYGRIVGHLDKPFNADDLVTLVARAADLQRTDADPGSRTP